MHSGVPECIQKIPKVRYAPFPSMRPFTLASEEARFGKIHNTKAPDEYSIFILYKVMSKKPYEVPQSDAHECSQGQI
jgi:hypothetical protein